MATPRLQLWNRPAAQACPWTVPLDFLEMIRWLHDCVVFHPSQLLCLGNCLPAHSFTTKMWVQAHAGWHCSRQGSQSPLVSFLFFSTPLCALHRASVSMRPPWEFTAMASDEINQALQIQVFFKKFWFIFQKQRKSIIQNLDLFFLCRMPGLKWGANSGTYEFKFSPGPASFQKVLLLVTSQHSNWTIIPPTPPFIFCKSPWVIKSEICKHAGILMWIFSSKIFKVTCISQYWRNHIQKVPSSHWASGGKHPARCWVC